LALDGKRRQAISEFAENIKALKQFSATVREFELRVNELKSLGLKLIW
jgi:hypothetical protein